MIVFVGCSPPPSQCFWATWVYTFATAQGTVSLIDSLLFLALPVKTVHHYPRLRWTLSAVAIQGWLNHRFIALQVPVIVQVSWEHWRLYLIINVPTLRALSWSTSTLCIPAMCPLRNRYQSFHVIGTLLSRLILLMTTGPASGISISRGDSMNWIVIHVGNMYVRASYVYFTRCSHDLVRGQVWARFKSCLSTISPRSSYKSRDDKPAGWRRCRCRLASITPSPGLSQN